MRHTTNSVDVPLSDVVLSMWGTPKHRARAADPLYPPNRDLNTDNSQVQSGQNAKLVSYRPPIRKLTNHSLKLLHGEITAFFFTDCVRQIPAFYDHYCYQGFLRNTAMNKPLSKRTQTKQCPALVPWGMGGGVINRMVRQINNNSKNPVKTAITKIKSRGDSQHVNSV